MAEIWTLPKRADWEGDLEEDRTRLVPRSEEDANALPVPVAVPSDAIYDELETDLVRRLSFAGVRSLMFTGTDDGVGVSTIAARFAQSVARDPVVRVLLVDAHLRAPSLDRMFKFPDGDSLFELLTGAPGLETLVPARVGNLSLLTAGRVVSNPRELFQSSTVGRVVKELSDKYDLVVFDAPPINTCIETRTLATRVGGVVLVVRGGQTRRRTGRLAVHQITTSGTPLMGIVLNGARSYVPRWLYDLL